MRYPEYLSFPYFAYSFLTLSLPVILLLRRWLEVRWLLRVAPLLQTVFEIAVETGIIYTTGNIHSAFSGLFVLTIISSALASNLAGTLGYASAISISYAFISWFGLAISGEPRSATRALETIFSTQDAAFYGIFLHILTFYLVAFISGFLVERLKRRDVQLATASQALRQARLDTGDILRHLNSGLLTVDKEGKIIYFNRAAEEILGYLESDVSGRDFDDIFSERMPALALNIRMALESRKQNPRSEIEIVDLKGQTIPLGISTSLLMDEHDDIRGIIAIFQDLTATKELEEKIRVSDRMAAIGELSAAIAHEIRNPLAAISGSVEVLKSELQVEGQNRRLMELIIRESGRLNKILTDFLLYARTNRSVFSRVELCHLVGDVFEVVRRHPSYRSTISLRYAASESCIYTYGDEDKIKQILINLLVNACEAMKDGTGKIEVRLKIIADGNILMELEDNGIGIERAMLAKIFDPFYSTKKQGTGLGLAIVQRLAESLKIGLGVRTQPGVGTTFILKFNPIPEHKAAISEAGPLGSEKAAAVK
jgi:two-component system sensor histidine kinase PilS (NtrC family)